MSVEQSLAQVDVLRYKNISRFCWVASKCRSHSLYPLQLPTAFYPVDELSTSASQFDLAACLFQIKTSTIRVEAEQELLARWQRSAFTHMRCITGRSKAFVQANLSDS